MKTVLKQFYPYEYAESVFAIDYEALTKAGFRAVIFDIDNTLVPHGNDSTPEIDELFRYIHSLGLKTLLLSNNSEERILRFKENIDSLYIHVADKPKPDGYNKALDMLGAEKNEAVVIGDQVFTDILGANRCGIPSILVRFIRRPDEIRIGKRRSIEQLILKTYFMRKAYCHRLGDILKKED